MRGDLGGREPKTEGAAPEDVGHEAITLSIPGVEERAGAFQHLLLVDEGVRPGRLCGIQVLRHAVGPDDTHDIRAGRIGAQAEVGHRLAHGLLLVLPPALHLDGGAETKGVVLLAALDLSLQRDVQPVILRAAVVAKQRETAILAQHDKVHCAVAIQVRRHHGAGGGYVRENCGGIRKPPARLTMQQSQPPTDAACRSTGNHEVRLPIVVIVQERDIARREVREERLEARICGEVARALVRVEGDI